MLSEEEVRREVIRLYTEEFKSTHQIAASLRGVPQSRVAKILHAANVPMRKKPHKPATNAACISCADAKQSEILPAETLPDRAPDTPTAETTEPTPATTAEASAVPTERITVENLTSAHCRWPIGDALLPGFHFCGKKPVPGKPYCQHHTNIAYARP